MTLMIDHLDTEQQRDAFAGRLFQTTPAALDLWGVYLGHHLGYYQALASGPQTSLQLAADTGTHERYAREWLEQQACSGILSVDDIDADPTAREYRLEPGTAEALTDTESLRYMVPLVRYFVASGLLVPELLDLYRTGGGIAWTRMGNEVREAQEGFNRAIYRRLLTTQSLPAIATSTPACAPTHQRGSSTRLRLRLVGHRHRHRQGLPEGPRRRVRHRHRRHHHRPHPRGRRRGE